jgi:hypothetical protein
MIIGDPSVFAIESEFTKAYERLSFRALGFFVLHVGNHCYGLRTPEATMLACSFDAVNRRIKDRGRHQASFSAVPEGGKLADAVRLALYADGEEPNQFYGLERQKFSDVIYSNDLLWGPDGDQAFDDGSYVLQFDLGEEVRVIAFQCHDGYLHDAATLRDVWLRSTDFYGVLEHWRNAFEMEWITAQKVSRSDEAS